MPLFVVPGFFAVVSRFSLPCIPTSSCLLKNFKRYLEESINAQIEHGLSRKGKQGVLLYPFECG